MSDYSLLLVAVGFLFGVLFASGVLTIAYTRVLLAEIRRNSSHDDEALR